MQTKKILILGATSSIAQAVAKKCAQQHLVLVARDQSKLATVQQDLLARGATQVDTLCYDLTDLSLHQQLLKKSIALLGKLDIVLIAHGLLPDQRASEQDFQLVEKTLAVNQTSVFSLLQILANQMSKQQHGAIGVISSVAAERGRRDSYLYASTKAAVSTFCQGLRHRLQKDNVSVTLLLPGFIETPMTAHMKKSPLWRKPEDIAEKMLRAIERGKYKVYLPWYWRPIMFVIRNMPDSLLRKLNI